MSNSHSLESFGVQGLSNGRPTVKTTVGSIKLLGFCWIIYGIAQFVLGVWLLAFQTTATLMFGALLTRVPNPFTLMDTFHLVYAAIILYSIICGVLGALAGLALLTGWSSARMLALWAGLLSLPELPLGLILGVYTVVRLLPAENGRVVAV
jgi:hypothetical protein